MKTGYVFIAVALWLVTPLAGQQPMIVFEHFNQDGGLPNNAINFVYQDRDGILWMPSFDGLIRHDGYTFTSYRSTHDDSTSLSDNNVKCVFEDETGRLWAGTIGSGLNVSNRDKTAFNQIPRAGNGRPGLRSNTINAIIQDPQENLWIAGDEGIEIFRYDSMITEPPAQMMQVTDQLNHLGSTSTFHLDSQGRLWIGTNGGIAMYDYNTRKLHTPLTNPDFLQFAISDIDEAPDGSIWFGCRKSGAQLYYLDTHSDNFIAFEGIPFASSGRSPLFAFDLDGRLWVTIFGDQAYGYDFRDSSVFLISSENSNIRSERFVRAPSVDHQGNVWIPGEGLYRYNFPLGVFRHLHSYGFYQANTHVAEIGNELWLAYREKGIVRYDRTIQSSTLLSTRSPKPEKLASDHIAVVKGLSTGKVAMAGFGAMMLYDLRTRTTKNTPVTGTTRAILEDSKGNIWLGAFRGLYKFSAGGDLLSMYSLPPRFGDGRNFIQGVQEDDEGNIWFASSIKGVARLDPETEELTQFLPENANRPFPADKILDLVYREGVLWAATNGGLVHYDIGTGSSKIYGTSHGIANDHITALLWSDGGFWMTTYGGVSRFDVESETFTNYGISDGFSNKTYYPRSKLLGSDGTIYFGGTNGVDYFRPERLRRGESDVRMALRSFSVNKEELRPSEILSASATELDHNDDIIEIEFNGLEFAHPELVEYAYRIEGLNDHWIPLGSSRRALIANLKPGSYTFRARARLPNREWSSEELRIPLVVHPPVWATWWFRLITIVLIGGTIILLVRYREMRIRQREERKKEVERAMMDLERRALLAQMNPHFIFNAMNSIQQFVAARDITGALKYLSMFSRLLRLVLNISRENRITLSDEITMIKDYLELESMRFPNKFRYSFAIDEDLDIHSLEIPPFLIQPQVENAIRHGLLNKGGEGHLQIAIARHNGHLKVTVEDNGIGRDAARKLRAQSSFHQQSQGLTIVEERLRHINHNVEHHKLRITDLVNGKNAPEGTRVEIFLDLD